MTFTPGPWRHLRFTGNKTWTVQRDDTHEAIANVRTGEADAALIAAAPDLLDALKEMVRAFSWLVDQNDDVGMDPKFLNDARAAIAKAEGN